MSAVVKKEKSKWRFVKYLLLIAFVIIIVLLIFSGNDASPKNAYNTKINNAKGYYQKLNVDDAILAFEEAIEMDPFCPDAYEELADLYYEEGDEAKAKATLERAKNKVSEDDLQEIIDKLLSLENGDYLKTNKDYPVNFSFLRVLRNFIVKVFGHDKQVDDVVETIEHPDKQDSMIDDIVGDSLGF